MTAHVHHVAERCGTCEHPHRRAPNACAQCAANGVSCPGWTQHPDVTAYKEDRELREMIDLGGDAVLSVDVSEGMLQSFVDIEAQQFLEADPDAPPMLAAIDLGGAHRFGTTVENLIVTNIIEPPADFWEGAPGSGGLIGLAQRWVHDHTRMPITVAWVLTAHGSIHDDDGEPKPAHLLLGADIDGRVYSVARLIDAAKVEYNVHVSPGWSRLMRGRVDPEDPRAVEIIEADDLSQGQLAVMQLMLVTRVEVERVMASEGWR